MSFFSKSSKWNHYKQGHYGSNHYKRNGLLGNLLNIIASRSNPGGYYNPHGYQNPNTPTQYPNTPLQYSNTPMQNPPHASEMICNRCSSQIPAGSKFCLHCGDKVNTSLFCISCGEKLPEHAKFCLKCGNKINA